MTTPELEAAAKAMYEAQPKMNRCRWVLLPANVKQPWIDAFAAGLRTLLPVSDAVVQAAVDADVEHQGMVSEREVITAAINHICGDDDAGK